MCVWQAAELGGGGCVETCYVVCLDNNIDRPKFVFDRLKSNSAGHSDRRLFLPYN